MVSTADHPQASRPSHDERRARLDARIAEADHAQDQLIEILHVAQDAFGYLSDDVLVHVARALRLPPSHVYGVATFYHLFELTPPGDHTCTVCVGTACFVKGASEIVGGIGEEYGVTPGGTSHDGLLTLRTARCLGSCGLAPFVVLDGTVHALQRPEDTLAAIAAVVADGASD
jgi:bidirectional [NiFe] hydrogenase diaphorase subunit